MPQSAPLVREGEGVPEQSQDTGPAQCKGEDQPVGDGFFEEQSGQGKSQDRGEKGQGLGCGDGQVGQREEGEHHGESAQKASGEVQCGGFGADGREPIAAQGGIGEDWWEGESRAPEDDLPQRHGFGDFMHAGGHGGDHEGG